MGCIQSKRKRLPLISYIIGNPLITAETIKTIKVIAKKINKNNNNDNQAIVASVIPFRNRATMEKTYVSNQEAQFKTKESNVSQMIRDYDRDFIIKVLHSHFLFKEISEKALNILLVYFKIAIEEQGALLFNELDTAKYFFIIKEGVVFMSSNEYNKTLISGESFGEMALFKEQQQVTTARCKERTVLYMLKGTFFRDIILKMNENELKKRLALITLVPFFKQISSIQLNNIASLLYKFDFERNEVIIREGDSGDSLYIICKGRVKCTKGNETVRVLKEKDSFGEFALLFNKKRSLTITASSNRVKCYQLCKSVLVDILGNDFKDIFYKGMLREALRNSQFFKLLSNEDYVMQIYAICHLKTFKAKEVIQIPKESEGKTGLRLQVLIEGNIVDIRKSSIVASRGELFGELYLKKKLSAKLQLTTFIAQIECQVLEFEWEKLIALLNFGVEEGKTLSFLNNLNHISKIPLCKNTSSKRLIEICKMMQKEKYKVDSIIFKEGDDGDKLYLIKKGKVEVTKDGKIIRLLEKGNCFGELALLVNNPRSATIKSLTEVTLYSLVKDNFEMMIESNMLEYLSQKMALQDNFQLDLKDLYFCKTLGKGKFGNVSLVHDRKFYYAIKAISRKITKRKKELIKYFIEERKVLLKLDHPFIMKLVKTFKNDQFIFYLMEFVNGKTLDRSIMKRATNRKDSAIIIQFIIGSLMLIIDFLNNKSVCHRDLKPENLMIDNKGFLKLIDFGTSIELNNFTNTVLGTPHYMAPEVLIGKGYSFSCDYWSIGIIFFELMFNSYPFGNKAIDPIEVYKEIFNKPLEFPFSDNPIANGLIAKLLKKKESERLCSFNLIKKDHFFNEFKWNELIDLSIESPLQPRVISLRKLSDYNCLYLDYLENEQSKVKNRFGISNSVSEDDIESKGDDDDGDKNGDSDNGDDNKRDQYKNWIDEF